MQDLARFFAYLTGVIVVSMAIMLTSNRFLEFVSDPGWPGLATLLAFGFLYLNLAYASIKRYIRKVPAPTNLHYVLALFIFLPPAIWILSLSNYTEGSELILTLTLLFACGLGTFYGNRRGIRERYEFIQKLKAKQEAMRAAEKTD
ncbi:MAG: hypothetical protein ACNA78_07505 [Balneolaceae bacterium]